MNYLKEIPTHLLLIGVCAALLALYYVRPDPVTVDLVKTFMGALLLSLKTNDQPSR